MDTKINSDLLLSKKSQNTSQTGSNTLGKDDFLKLLITQLQNQDPTDPMQDKDFISQMATFSSLEQMTNLNQSMQQFLTVQSSSSLLQQSEMIGKTVTYQVDQSNSDGTSTSVKKDGTVQSVMFDNGAAKLEMDDGTIIDPSQVVKVSKTAIS